MHQHKCIIHGCAYITARKWNLFTHLQRKHQYPENLIDSMKKLHNSIKDRDRKKLEEAKNYQFKCETCDLAYPNKKRLNEHFKRRHPDHFATAKTSQVICPVPGCVYTCQTRELLVHHAQNNHATPLCPYKVQHVSFQDEQDYQIWKQDLEKATDSVFSVNSSTPVEAQSKRVYLWCAKANKVRTSKPIPDSERKRFGNYRGRTKRVQSHCTAFITVWYQHSGEVDVKYCRDHIGHNQPEVKIKSEKKRTNTNVVKREAEEANESDEQHSDEGDEYIDVGDHIDIDHEEYVEDDGAVVQGMYSDHDEDVEEKSGAKLPPIRYLTATDRLRPQLNPSYEIEEEYEEEEEEEEELPSQPSTSMRYLPAVPSLQHPQATQGLSKLGYVNAITPRPVQPNISSDVKDAADLSMALLRESRNRVMHAAKTKKVRATIGGFNHNLQGAMKQFDAPVRRTRRSSTKNESMSQSKEEDCESNYELDPEDVGHEEEVIEEAVYDDLPGTSYQEYYEE